MSFEADKLYGRRGGGWAPADPEDRSVAEIKAQHLADPPAGCACLWCVETAPESPQLTMFEETNDADPS